MSESHLDQVPMIGLFRGKSMTSKMIKFQTRGEYSHAAIIFPDFVVEAWADSFFPMTGQVYQRPIGVGHTPQTEIDVFEINPKFISKEKVHKANQFLMDQIGKGYDFWMVLGFFFRTDFENRRSSNKWFCSELAYAYMQKLELPLFKRSKPYEIHPDMLKRLQVLHFKYKTIPKVK